MAFVRKKNKTFKWPVVVREPSATDAGVFDESEFIAVFKRLKVSEYQKAVEEKTEFDLLLAEVPADKKIAILKEVRGITGLGLKEAKELVEAAPKVVAEALGKDAAETAQKQIEEAGGKAELK